MGKFFKQNFDTQAITMTRHVLVNFHLEQVVEDDGPGTATMKVDTKCDGSATDDSGHIYYPLTLTVEAAPSGGSSYYKCNITMQGIFAAGDGSNIDDDQARMHVLTDGANELYAIAKGYVAQITACGAFGSFSLPSLKATGEVVDE